MINRIPSGTSIPEKQSDSHHGYVVENMYESNGNTVDRTGVLDLPDHSRDIKTHTLGSNASHTQGSITKDKLKITPWNETDIYQKVQQQDVVIINNTFNIIKETIDTDMRDETVQRKFEEDYHHVQKEIINGNLSKDIYGPNRYLVGDNWGHENSVRFRIPDKAMREIIAISRTLETRKKLFE